MQCSWRAWRQTDRAAENTIGVTARRLDAATTRRRPRSPLALSCSPLLNLPASRLLAPRACRQLSVSCLRFVASQPPDLPPRSLSWPRLFRLLRILDGARKRDRRIYSRANILSGSTSQLLERIQTVCNITATLWSAAAVDSGLDPPCASNLHAQVLGRDLVQQVLEAALRSLVRSLVADPLIVRRDE